MQKVVPAILTDSAEDLERKLQSLQGASEWVHIDIMDGSFVPNQSFNLKEWSGAEDYSIEIHLMVSNPIEYLEDCKRIGAKRVLIHVESENSDEAIEKREEYGFEIGLVLNIETPIDTLSGLSGDIDSAMLMSVHSGFQGQPFLPESLGRAKETKERFPDLLLAMDGGMSRTNIKKVFETGVDYIIIGSKVIAAEDPVAALRSVQEMVQ
jgi:ribulose-phosphate 3-epimerase